MAASKGKSELTQVINCHYFFQMSGALLCAIVGFLFVLSDAKYMPETLFASDLTRLRGVLDSQSRFNDLCSIYYSVLGSQSLEAEVADKAVCLTLLKT